MKMMFALKIMDRANIQAYEQSEGLTLPTVLQDANSLTDVPQVERCLVVTAHVLPDLSCKPRRQLLSISLRKTTWQRGGLRRHSPIFIILRSFAKFPVMR